MRGLYQGGQHSNTVRARVQYGGKGGRVRLSTVRKILDQDGDRNKVQLGRGHVR